MKATVSKAELTKAINYLGKIVERKNTIPILSCVRLEFSAGELRLTATNLKIYLSLRIEAECDSKTTVVIELGILKRILGATEGGLSFEVVGDAISISDGKANIRINSFLSPDDFPISHWWKNRRKDKDSNVGMSQGEWLRLFNLSEHCISSEQTRYYLSGVFLCSNTDTGNLRAVATDGNRLALIDTDVSFSPEDRGYIVHKKTVHLLKSLMDSKANDPVTLTFNEAMMNVELPGGGCISAKLIDHTYPDYTRVVPASSDNITVALGDGIRRLNAFSPNGMVKIGFDKSAISIKTSDGNEIEMPCQIKFADGVTPFDIGFNIKYLAQQQSLTQNFRLRGAKQGDPCVIDSSDPNAKWVIMPMRL